jgi:MFS family permease
MPLAVRDVVRTRRRWVALIVVCFAMLMNSLDQTIVNVALPTIQRDLHFTQASLAWIIDAYLITFAGALLLAGRLGDLVGRKKVFLVGVALFTLSSAACGAADTQALLIGARFAKGLGAALSSSVILAIIVADFPVPAERAKAMSSYIIVAVGGGSLGLLVGGYVTQVLSWHWIFFINLPIGIATFVLGAALIDDNDGLGIRAGLDVGGAVLSTAGLMLAVYAIVSSTQYGWHSAHTLWLGGAAVVVLAAFVVLESRLATPMMPLGVLRAPGSSPRAWSGASWWWACTPPSSSASCTSSTCWASTPSGPASASSPRP